MEKVKKFWYRRILAMVVITLSMVIVVLSGNKQTISVTEAGNNITSVYPCGFPVGIYLETEGVMVIGSDIVTGADGINYDPAYGIVRSGDYIVAINDIDVSAKSQLGFLIQKYGENDIILTLNRAGEMIDVKITPVKVANNQYKLGIWVRDDSHGIGTMTFIKLDGSFGSLGHGISDIDTQQLLDSNEGLLYGAKIWGITKGQTGKAGSLCGSIAYEDDNIVGTITKNSSDGIFGSITNKSVLNKLIDEYSLKPMDVGGKHSVTRGDATILCCISGKVKEYSIKIEEINLYGNSNKDLVLKVTDKELLDETGGIVQGMFTSYNGSNNRKASKIKGFLMF